MNKPLIAIFLILFLIIATFYIQVRYFGVSIDNFRFKSYYIEDLYIKYDEKWSLSAKKIDLSSLEDIDSDGDFSNIDIKKTVTYIWDVLKYFETINIDHCAIKEHSFSIAYNKEYFFFENNLLKIQAKPEIFSDFIDLNIDQLYIKNYDILTSGEAKIDLNKLTMNYFGAYSHQEVKGGLGLNITSDYIDFFVDSKETKDIKFVKNFVTLHPEIEKWMYDSVFGDYSLEYLKGKIDLSKQELILNSLEGKANISNAKIRFHKKLDFVNTDKIEVIYQRNTLSFNLINPIYKNISIDGSFVEITNITNDILPASLLVNITTDHLLDSKILDILKAYEIDIPLIQKEGNTNATVMIKVNLNDSSVEASGAFDVKNAFIKIEDFEFYVNSGKVWLKDTIVQIKNFDAYIKNLIDATGSMTIDTTTKIIEGNANIQNFKVSSQDEDILFVKNHNANFTYDLNNNTLTIDNLTFKMNINDNSLFTINIDDLLTFKPYLNPNIDISNINSCSLNLYFKDFDNIHFGTKISLKDSILYKENSQILDFDLVGSYNNDELILNNSDKSLILNYFHNTAIVKLNNFDIYYNFTDDTQTKENDYILSVSSQNSRLFVDNTMILSDDFTLYSSKDKTEFNSNYQNSSLQYIKDKDNTTINAQNLNDKFINSYLNKEFIKGGYVNFVLNKDNKTDNKYMGEVNIFDSKLENLAIVNNLLTFIETSPAIINPLLALPSAYRALKDGIGHDGFAIVYGNLKVIYDEKDNLFNIYEGYLQGSRSDLIGNLLIDRNNRLVDGNINVVILKDYSNVVKHIPIVGYILLGEDESISLSTKVSGDLDDPQIETFATSDAIEGTSNIIKRIFLSPFKLFD